MPLTDAQKTVLQLLAVNRSKEAYLAGGLISARDGNRYSDDVDDFHDSPDVTLATFDLDKRTLEANGYEVTLVNRPQPGFVRAVVSDGTTAVKIGMPGSPRATWKA